jgi:hypothetical protein
MRLVVQYIYLNQPRKAWKGANGKKTGNYDSATPLLHWLKSHKKWQMRLKGECQKHRPLKMASSQQRRAILNAGWPRALGSGDFSRLWSKIIGKKRVRL